MGTKISAGGPTLMTAIGLGALGLCALLLWNMARPGTSGAGERPLLVHCAAGIRIPVEALATEFEERTGQRVELQYGGSGTLLSAIQAGARGDLYIAGDASFVERAQSTGEVRESLDLAKMKAVLGVARGNPLGVQGLQDLTRGDLRVGLGSPDAAAIGRLGRSVLQAANLWQDVLTARKVEKPTVNELANDLAIGALDVAIVWDATIAGIESLEIVRVKEFEAQARLVTVGLLESSGQPARALAFARLLASKDVGAPVFRANGFAPLGGDAFVERPKLVLMSGAMLRPAVQETLRAFGEREGVRVECIYNGCGMLVAQMQAGRWPDAYLSCDLSFLELVEERFEPGSALSSNPMVILVQPGNPHGILRLSDLLQSDLRVGLGHPKKSALGTLTHKLLADGGHLEALLASGNLKVESPTGDMLVNQLRAGSLDASIVYASNAALAGAEVQLVPLALEGALAVQPVAIQRDTEHRELLLRLIAELQSAQSRARFEELGFQWLGPEQP